MFNVFVSVALIAFIGSMFGWLFPAIKVEQLRKGINTLVLYILLPALIFDVLYLTEMGKVFYEVPIVAVAGILVCLITAWIVFKFINIKKEAKGALILASAFGNVTYLGLPVLQGIFSTIPLDISKVAILYEVTKSPVNLTLGSAIAMRHSGTKRITLKESLLEILKLPPVWALALALLCKAINFPVPDFILQSTKVLGSAVTALMILSLGMALKFQKFKHIKALIPVCIIKLFLSPIIVFIAAGILGMKAPYFEAVTIEGAMPCQLLTFVIADKFNLDTEILAMVILLNTVLAFFTIPLIRVLLF